MYKIHQNNNYICFDPTPEGFFLDMNDNIFKKCYETCKYCYSEGNEANNNNCIECITNYTLLNESTNYNNCYIRCSHYYFFDESNIMNALKIQFVLVIIIN